MSEAAPHPSAAVLSVDAFRNGQLSFWLQKYPQRMILLYQCFYHCYGDYVWLLDATVYSSH